MRLHGQEPDLRGLRPRARTLLRFLALHAGRPVHREEIVDALWPNLRHAAGIRNLQVTVSNLRVPLEPDARRGTSRLIPRQGESYLLALPADGSSDVRAFDRATEDGRRARGGRRLDAAAEALRAALALYAGDLLPEDGPADWVVAPREQYRQEAAEAAGMLAEIELQLGRLEAAIEAARRSLAIDSFRDASWRVLVEASQRAGNAASATRARQAYNGVLRSLGVVRQQETT
jgi:DNA-binding SARP family transcriptional activator